LAELERVRGVERIDVPRMSHSDVTELITEVMGAAPAPNTAVRVFERSEGIPYFVEELITADPDHGSGSISDPLRDVLLLRVDQLSEPAQSLLRLMATGGDRVDHALVAAVAEISDADLDESLREAVSANVIRVDGDTYVFRHALLREALHNDTLPGAHVRYHATYAQAIEADPTLVRPGSAPSELAHHWYGAHDQERAFAACLAAAEVSELRYAFAEAQSFLERALELWSRVTDPVGVAGGDYADLLLRTSIAAYDAGELERALALTEAALEEPELGIKRYERLLMQRCKAIGILDRADSLDIAVDTLSRLAADSSSRPAALSMLAGRHMTEKHTEAAIRAANEAIAASRAIGDREAEFRAFNVLGPSLATLGDAAGMDAFEQAKALVDNDPRRLVAYLVNYSHTLNELGRFTDAAEVASGGMKVAADIGLARTSGAMVSGNAAEPLIALGEWGDADRIVTRALELDPPQRHYWHLLSLRATLSLWRGDLDDCAATIDELRARMARYSPGPQYSVPVLNTSVALALARGEHAAAWAIIEPEFALGREPSRDVRLLISGAQVVAAHRRVNESIVQAHVDMLLNAAEQVRGGDLVDFGRAVVRAELNEGDGVPAAWQDVLDFSGKLEGPAIAFAYAGYHLGEAYIDRGERQEAAAALRDARARADRLGATLITGWIDDLARRAGLARLTDASGPAASAHGLTDREHEVLRLVAAGRTNRQIGEELFISAKTASVHVSNILAKLAVASRTEAAAAALQRGILGR
jgi:DNA-binding CsgD family transcriptional regulator